MSRIYFVCLDAREDEDGDIIITEAQGNVRFSYEEAENLRDMLDEYMSLGRDYVNELNRIDIEWSQRPRVPTPVQKKVKPQPGWVYLLREVNGTHWKIGRTKNGHQRKCSFGVILPFEVAYEVLIQTGDMLKLEKELHTRFSEKRVKGEWFALQAEDVEYIKSLAGGAE